MCARIALINMPFFNNILRAIFIAQESHCFFASQGKVKRYRALEDSIDGNGHGTHVCGILEIIICLRA
jgi:hypothetical protein